MRFAPLFAVLCLVGVSSASANEPAPLTQAEFDRLQKELQSPRELWQSIPWKLSLLDARAEAAKEKRPIYMLCRSGHPLACV
jgi:hypothetical protein